MVKREFYGRQKRPDVKHYQIAYLWGLGWKTWEIGKRYHMNESSIVHRLQMMGFMVKPRPVAVDPEFDQERKGRKSSWKRDIENDPDELGC